MGGLLIITSITEGTNTRQYLYNELNEVVWENNQRDNKSFVYNYDLGGNLLSKVEYAYTTWPLGTPVSTISYAYTNSNWKDLLTSFNGQAITYDTIGNPLTYNGGTYGWEGRKLTSFNNTDMAISYSYNENGIRTSKTVSGVKTDYRLSGDKVTFEQTGSDTIYYVYDTQGSLISMILNGTEYAYLRNAQNDIVGLIDSAGSQVVAYTYSTWGEVLTVTGSLASTLGMKNPYRYRGYRYDSETGLFYVGSRYYDPEIGRFINADSVIVGVSGAVLGYNLFSYCVNNPINMADEDGQWPQWIKNVTKIATGTAIIGGLAAATVLTGGAVAVIAGAALSGAVIGGGIGAVSGGIIGGISGGWQSALDGACSGFFGGVVTGAITNGAMAGVNIATGTTAIVGNAHGSALHKLTTNLQAGQMAASGQFTQIGLNKSLSTMGLNGSFRPDVIGIGKNGVNMIVEVVSLKQSVTYIGVKTTSMVAQNPGAVGKIIGWVRAIGKFFGGN